MPLILLSGSGYFTRYGMGIVYLSKEPVWITCYWIYLCIRLGGFMKSYTLHTKAEKVSNLDRQRWAEMLILQLPKDHDGRNSWLLNFGVLTEAEKLREKKGMKFDETYKAATK